MTSRTRYTSSVFEVVSAGFLREDVAATFRRAGWPVKRVLLVDRGREFKGTVDERCLALRILHTRTKPRHAFTNGFVERLQQTILHDHWRVKSPCTSRS
jgi:hypothetical protein